MMTRLLPILLILSAARLVAEPARLIALQPLGPVAAEHLEVVKRGLEEAFALQVELLQAKDLPQQAWHEPRRRYRAEKLLAWLDPQTHPKFRIVLGITAKDISTTKDDHEDWGIFGLGDLDGRACVVSTFRLGARGAGEALLRERLRRMALHEVGHVLSLEHCPEADCVMQNAEGGIANVDEGNGNFCAPCRKQAEASLAKPED